MVACKTLWTLSSAPKRGDLGCYLTILCLVKQGHFFKNFYLSKDHKMHMYIKYTNHRLVVAASGIPVIGCPTDLQGHAGYRFAVSLLKE